MRTRNFLISLLLSHVLASTHAAENPPSPNFSGGFQQLAELGLPALDIQAQWCTHPEADNNNYELRDLTKSLKGNGWLLPSADNKTRLIAMGGASIIDVEQASLKLGSKPKPATLQDLAKDVTMMISRLEKIAATPERQDPFSGESKNTNCGQLFLFAAQLHQTGHTELANRLAMAIFSVYPTHESAVDDAIDKLGDYFYQESAREFFASGDWSAYQKTLAELIKRFPRGWASKDAVTIMLPQLEKQAAGAKPNIPSLPNIPIDPRALEIISELTEKPTTNPEIAASDPSNNSMTTIRYRHQMMMHGIEYSGGESIVSPLWLIQQTTDPKEKKTTLARLTELKMAALPALAAISTDPFFTHLPNARSHSNYYSSEESHEEQILRTYSSLNRPCTLGEIAKQCLTATLPDQENDLDEADAETLRDLALDFWKQHKDASDTDLVAVFLSEGSSNQAAQAANILASSNDPKDSQIFETHVLASEQAISYFRSVQTYLKTRKSAGKSFLASYTKIVRSQDTNDSEENENSWEIDQAGGVGKILKNLESLVASESPSKLAIKIAKGPPGDAKSGILTLNQALEDATPKKQLFAYLEGANATTDVEIRVRFLYAISSISWNEKTSSDDEENLPVLRKVIDAEAAIWRKLLDDKREIPYELNQHSDLSTIAELAAAAFEDSISRDNVRATWEAAPVLGTTAAAMLLEQASARLAGKPISPLPDAKRVPQARLKTLVEEAGKKTSIEIHPYLQTLSPDERAAWREWILEPGEIVVPKSVEALKLLVIEKITKSRWPYPMIKDSVGIDVGFAVSASSLKAYVESVAKNLDQHSRNSITLSHATFGPGLQVAPIKVSIPEKKAETSDTDSFGEVMNTPNALRFFNASIGILKDQEAADGAIVINSSSLGVQEGFVWLVEQGKAKPLDSETLSTFDASFEAPDPDRIFYIRIEILSKSDAEKITSLTEK